MVEQVRVRLAVSAPLALGFETATLVFTDSRLIVARLGKHSSRFLLGNLEKRIAGALKGREEAKKIRLVESSTPEQILRSDPANFEVAYGEIVGMELEVRERLDSALRVVTGDDKFSFRLVSTRPPEGFEQEMYRLLGQRFTTRTVRTLPN